MMTSRQVGFAGAGRALGAPLSSNDVSQLIDLTAGVTKTVLDAVPALQRSQIERLAAKERKLLEQRAKARSAAARRAIDAELAGVRFQMNQYAQAAQDLGEPTVVVRKPRSANMTAVVVGGLLLVGVVGGAVLLARRA